MIGDINLSESEIQDAISILHPDLLPFLTSSPWDPTLHALRHGYGDLLSHAAEKDPEECVGMLWHTGEITRLINQSRSTAQFSVGESQFIDGFSRVPDEYALVGIYHSHPQSSPFLSAEDLTWMRQQWGQSFRVPWIVICPDGNLYCWTLDDDFQPEVAAFLTDWGIWVYGPDYRTSPHLPWSMN